MNLKWSDATWSDVKPGLNNTQSPIPYHPRIFLRKTNLFFLSKKFFVSLVCYKIDSYIPGLTSQRHSPLISSDSEYFQVCFSAVHYLKISEQRWFSSEQRWKRKFSEQKNQRWIRAVSALIFSETALKHQIFRTKKSALNQSRFSADFLWNRAEQRWFFLKQRWKPKNSEQKNQLWISAVSALIFPERELIPTEAFLNSSHLSWFSPETTLNIPRHLILFPQTSAGKLRSYLSWKFRNYSVMAKSALVLFS